MEFDGFLISQSRDQEDNILKRGQKRGQKGGNLFLNFHIIYDYALTNK